MTLKSRGSKNSAPISLTRNSHEDFNERRAGVDEPRASNP